MVRNGEEMKVTVGDSYRGTRLGCRACLDRFGLWTKISCGSTNGRVKIRGAPFDLILYGIKKKESCLCSQCRQKKNISSWTFTYFYISGEYFQRICLMRLEIKESLLGFHRVVLAAAVISPIFYWPFFPENLTFGPKELIPTLDRREERCRSRYIEVTRFDVPWCHESYV